MNIVKVFSATMAKERSLLGERITEWIASNRDVEISAVVVKQSSDSEFHCISIVVFAYQTRARLPDLATAAAD